MKKLYTNVIDERFCGGMILVAAKDKREAMKLIKGEDSQKSEFCDSRFDIKNLEEVIGATYEGESKVIRGKIFYE